MPTVRLPPKGARPFKKPSKGLKRKRDDEELAALEKRVSEFDLQATEFSQLPLTKQTANGLHRAHFKTLTDIQRRALPAALQGRDVLGAAKTGSGKTLAFLVPVLELLYRKKWSSLDGLGALIISPTRELATQIFEVLRKIGCEHAFSAGLVIGGSGLREQRAALHRMNILVCTPGRMLQHMDQTVGFNLDNVQLLVLDEADRILDMGFRTTLDAIIAGLPRSRQTLLFSATQTSNVADLARLSLSNPEYIAVHEAAAAATPVTLQQFYMRVPLPEKLNTLFSFLRSHLRAKTIVFVTSCKQVRFLFETFRQLHVGLPLLHLHGKQKQPARAEVARRFVAAGASCLFSTDVVARGLDFPAVDWIVQLDAPEDTATYIHRVGRTARFERAGNAVLFLAPSEEEAMVARLEAAKVPVTKVTAKTAKQQSIATQLQGLCFKDPELKYLGQKAFVSYCRSVSVQKDRQVFDLAALPLEEYATSLGLPGAPRIRGLKNIDVARTKALKNAPRGLESLGDEKVEKQVRTKYDRMVERQNQTVLADHYKNILHDDPAAEDDDSDFLTVKRTGYSDSSSSGSDSTPAVSSKRRSKIATSRKAAAKLMAKGTKLVFDDDGTAHAIYELKDEDEFRAAGTAAAQRERFVQAEGERVKDADVEDRKLAKEKRREKKEKRKRREAEAEAEAEVEAGSKGSAGAPRFLPYEAPEEVEVEEEEEEEEEEGEEEEREEEEEEEEEEGRGVKRQRKWFEDKLELEHKAENIIEAVEEPESLEDLEALASGLLG